MASQRNSILVALGMGLLAGLLAALGLVVFADSAVVATEIDRVDERPAVILGVAAASTWTPAGES